MLARRLGVSPTHCVSRAHVDSRVSISIRDVARKEELFEELLQLAAGPSDFVGPRVHERDEDAE